MNDTYVKGLGAERGQGAGGPAFEDSSLLSSPEISLLYSGSELVFLTAKALSFLSSCTISMGKGRFSILDSQAVIHGKEVLVCVSLAQRGPFL